MWYVNSAKGTPTPSLRRNIAVARCRTWVGQVSIGLPCGVGATLEDVGDVSPLAPDLGRGREEAGSRAACIGDHDAFTAAGAANELGGPFSQFSQFDVHIVQCRMHRGGPSVALESLGATLTAMPTTRPRHFVTETDDLAEALDRAAKRWPGVSRPQLLVRLALEGDRAAAATREDLTTRRLAAIDELSGSLTGVFGPGYLDDLRADWPS